MRTRQNGKKSLKFVQFEGEIRRTIPIPLCRSIVALKIKVFTALLGALRSWNIFNYNEFKNVNESLNIDMVEEWIGGRYRLLIFRFAKNGL